MNGQPPVPPEQLAAAAFQQGWNQGFNAAMSLPENLKRMIPPPNVPRGTEEPPKRPTNLEIIESEMKPNA